MVVHSTGEGLPYSRYLNYRTQGIAVILTIEYCTVVRRSCAGRETMANGNPYYSPKGTFSIVMSGHWKSFARVYFHHRAFLAENNVRFLCRGKKRAILPYRFEMHVTTTNTLCNLFFIVSIDVLKTTRNSNESVVPNAACAFNDGELLTLHVRCILYLAIVSARLHNSFS